MHQFEKKKKKITNLLQYIQIIFVIDNFDLNGFSL